MTWQDNATNEFAFQIERCANSGCTNFAPLAGLGANTTSYNDTTVANSTTYRYRVRAVNVLGPSQYTDIVDATTPTPPFTFRAVGAHFPTVENADQGGGPGPRVITPPASLQPGDLMVIVAAYRGTATLTLSETGGQVWTSETNAQANGQTVRLFWSQFNGFWTANPAVSNTTGTLPLTVYSFAFDMAPGLYPVIDVPFVAGSHSGGTVTVPTFNTSTDGALALAGWISGDNNTWGTPKTGWSTPEIDVTLLSESHSGGTAVTVPSFTTNTAGTLALVGWISDENNSWSAPTTGWSVPGGQQQWRNTQGEDTSIALAYRVFTAAGPTGSIVRGETDGPNVGLHFRLAWKQVTD